MSNTLFPRIRASVEEDSALKAFQPDLNIRLICPECENTQPNLIEEYASGDLVCGDCGLVLGDRIIDTRSEWRTFNNEEGNSADPSRVGFAADPLLENSALETIILSKGDTNINKIHDKATTSRSDMMLKQELLQINVMCDSMDLTKEISDTAKQLCKRAFEEKLLRGKNKVAMYAACIHAACRIKKVARTIKEICAIKVVKAYEKDVAKCFKKLRDTFELNLDQMTSEDLMIRFSNKLNLPKETQNIATKLSKRAEELSLLTGRTQNTIASACIYLASKISHYDIAVGNIAKVFGITTDSIKNAYRLLYDKREKFKDFVDIKESCSVVDV